MRTYVHQLTDWPRLHWRDDKLAVSLAGVTRKQGRMLGRMTALGFDLRTEARAIADMAVPRLPRSRFRCDRDDPRERLQESARFREKFATASLNQRQRKVIDRLLDGFEGKLTSSKWAALTKSSQDAALRDIDDLIRQGVLVKEAAGGRGTGYILADI